EHLTGLTEVSSYPWGHDEFKRGDLVYSTKPGAGWYTTGDHYYTVSWKGREVGLLCKYGNAALAYVPADVADEWYRLAWEKNVAQFGEATHAKQIILWLEEYRGCYGSDYYEWAERTIGIDQLAVMARGKVYRFVPGIGDE